MDLNEILQNLEANKIIELDLSHRKLNDKDVAILAKALPKNSSLCLLNLSNNWITDAGIQVLLEGLEHNFSLLTVNIVNNWNDPGKAIAAQLQRTEIKNDIDSSLMNKMTQYLKRNRALKMLTEQIERGIFNNKLKITDKIDKPGILALAYVLKNNKQFVELDLGNNATIDEECLISFYEAIKNNYVLLSFSMFANLFNTSEILAKIKQCITRNIILNKLCNQLRNNMIDLAGEGMNLELAEMVFTTCRELYPVEQVRVVNLKNNNLGEKGIKALFQLLKNAPFLAELNLTGNELSYQSMLEVRNFLLSHKNLKKISLGYAHLNQQAIGMLAETLKTNLSLEEVDLSGNSIDDEGMALLIKVLKLNRFIGHLNLELNNISNLGAKLLIQMLSECHLSYLKIDLAENLVTLGAISAINYYLQADRSADMKISPILWAIKQNDAGMVKFLVSTGLVDLEAVDEKGDTPLGIAASCGFTECAKWLIEAGANIKHKNIEGEVPFSLAYKNKHLPLARYIGQASKSPKWLEGYLQELTNPSNKEVDLSCGYILPLHPEINNQHVRKIAKVLATNPKHLISLNLDGNAIGEVGSRTFLKALQTNTTLLTLNLNNNKSIWPISDSSREELAKLLRRNREINAENKKEILSGESHFVTTTLTDTATHVSQTLPTKNWYNLWGMFSQRNNDAYETYLSEVVTLGEPNLDQAVTARKSNVIADNNVGLTDGAVLDRQSSTISLSQ